MTFIHRHIHIRWALLSLFPVLTLTAAGQSVNHHTGRTGYWRQDYPVRRVVNPHNDPVYQHYATRLDTLIAKYRGWQYEGADTLSNPYYTALMGSSTLYGATLQRRIGTIVPDSGLSTRTMLPSSQHAYNVTYVTDLCLASVYTQYPWFVHYEEAKQGTLDVDHEIREGVKTNTILTDQVSEAKPEEEHQGVLVTPDDDLQIVVRRPNFWTFKTNFSLQFTQNYVSDNWHKGGESSNSLLASTEIQANFNNQRKVTFDNKLEMRLGFQRTKDDNQHKFRTNSDLLRLTNKLGLKAVKHWYYTVLLQSWTQFYKGYKSNDPKVYSDFMSPFESLLSVGMDYQFKSKNNRFSINATLSPLALKLKYVNRPSLAGSFGLDQGKHAKWEYGLNVTANYNWDIVKNVRWSGRLYYFSDYKKVQVEWENTVNLTINRFLSAKLFFYPRFDDSQSRKPGKSYFQFNELLSTGLNVNF